MEGKRYPRKHGERERSPNPRLPKRYTQWTSWKTKDSTIFRNIIINRNVNDIRKNPSLMDLTFKTLADTLSNQPEKFLADWKQFEGSMDLTHLMTGVIANLPPYSIQAWWNLYNIPELRAYCPYFELVHKIQQYETVYLEIMRGTLDKLLEKTDHGFPLPIPKSFKTFSDLINVYKNYDTFVIEPLSEEERDVGRLYFSNHPPFRPSQAKASSEVIHSVVPLEQFHYQFGIFTNNLFTDWKDWDNMAIIGGSVVASLLPVPMYYSESPEKITRFFTNVAYPASDIDIYIYGVTKEQFLQKLKKIYEHLKKKTNNKVMMVKTTFTLTFVMEFPNRPVQVVFGDWKTLDHVLLEPDIDCTCVAYTGSSVIASQRARLSLNKRWIVASPQRYKVRQFPEYESRLVKYSRRGFYIVDEQLNWNRVSKKLVDLAKERLLEHKCVRGRTGVYGLRLLIAAVKYPEIVEKVDMFQKPSFKEDGIAYAPGITLNVVRKELSKPVYELTNYGPSESPNPYVEITDLDSLNFTLQCNLDAAHWRFRPDWYDRIWKDKENEYDSY